MRFRSLSLFILVLASFLSSKLEAQNASTTPAPWEAPAFSSSPKDVVGAAAAIKPEQYATVTIFNEESRITFDSSERAVSIHRLFYRVEAKDALVRPALYYRPAWRRTHKRVSPQKRGERSQELQDEQGVSSVLCGRFLNLLFLSFGLRG